MKNRVVDEEIVLVRYYPNYKTTLAWYQDLDLCKQVDNRDTVYDLELLKCMYKYLDKQGDLFYIKYKNRLCGDVCLQPSGEVNIVISKSFQNKHIGRRVINEIIQLAKQAKLTVIRNSCLGQCHIILSAAAAAAVLKLSGGNCAALP